MKKMKIKILQLFFLKEIYESQNIQKMNIHIMNIFFTDYIDEKYISEKLNHMDENKYPILKNIWDIKIIIKMIMIIIH